MNCSYYSYLEILRKKGGGGGERENESESEGIWVRDVIEAYDNNEDEIRMDGICSSAAIGENTVLAELYNRQPQ